MRLARRIARILIVLVLALAALAYVKREELTRLMAVNSLFDADRIVANFSHMDSMFLTVPLPAAPDPQPLPQGAPVALPAEVADWVKARSVTAMVVLKDGKVVAEDYFQGTGKDDLRISWSMAKSYLSALFGVVLAEGKIASLDDPVTRYAPALIGSAYEGATIRNVLNMASGVTFDEDYLDFWSDINRMGRVLALGGTLDGFAAGLKQRAETPGQHWHYVSIDTHVIGMVIRGATGESIDRLMDERILAPIGQVSAGYYVTDGRGVAFVLGGLNMTTRDYARLGQLFLQNGAWNGTQVVPADWVAASTTPSAPTDPGQPRYGYQWWIPADGPGAGREFYAIGIYGQYIYVDRDRGVVIAINSADRGFEEPGVEDGNIAMFRRIAAAL
jgi:CubicO group peptidase (beta-lactamase class C family)